MSLSHIFSPSMSMIQQKQAFNFVQVFARNTATLNISFLMMLLVKY
jgi:hypothetical protein